MVQGAIMAVGASRPTVIADKDGFFCIKNEMLVSLLFTYSLCPKLVVSTLSRYMSI
jgi:hypothetical protein